MSKKLKQMLAAYGLVLPSFLTVMLVVAWPILTAIKTSFTDPDTGGFTFDNYKYFFETPRELTNILFTLGIVFLTVALAIVLAYLLALYLRFVKSKVSRLIGNLYLLPRFVPSMVAVYAMITVVRDSGLLNRISQLFGGEALALRSGGGDIDPIDARAVFSQNQLLLFHNFASLVSSARTERRAV